MHLAYIYIPLALVFPTWTLEISSAVDTGDFSGSLFLTYIQPMYVSLLVPSTCLSVAESASNK